MSGTIVEKFFRQSVNKLVYRFNIESGVEVGDGSTPWVVTNNSKTFRLKNLKMTIVGRRSTAPNVGGIGKYGADQ